MNMHIPGPIGITVMQIFMECDKVTLIYEYNNKECTLEDLINRFPSLWAKCLKREYDFWACNFRDLIIETSDEFEEILQIEGENLKFKFTSEKDFDLNIIFQPLLDLFIKE